MDLSIERWQGLTSAERESLAKRLVLQLPVGFSFQAIRTCQLGEQQNHVAFFQKEDAIFAFIPGGQVSLGYDAEREWEPNSDELEDWQGTAEEYGLDKALPEYIAEATLRTRMVELDPFLMETTAGELGWEVISSDDPKMQEMLSEFNTQGPIVVHRAGASTRFRRFPDGSVVAERSLSRTHAELAAYLKAQGFRFPTSNEWEYACGAGTRTLFRWGDHVPCDRYPTDQSARGWHHQRPNAFGLLIASDPYRYELVTEIGLTRGGDGGCTICGGAGFFLGWLTLATAYFEEHACNRNPLEPVSPGYTIGRKVLGL